MAAAAQAQTVDGTKDASYGSAVAVQTIQTGFGSAPGGSELDAAYAHVSGGELYLFFAGNLQQNYNHLNVWIDNGTGGTNTISAGSGNPLNPFNGVTLPTGFNASTLLDINGGGTPATYYVNQDAYSGGTWSGSYLGKNTYTNGGNLSGGANPNGTLVAINNSNTTSIGGTTGAAVNAATAESVTTGIEIGISLASLGSPGSLKIFADINGSGDNYFSNQFLTGLNAGTGNIGTPTNVNLNRYGAGYFVVNSQAVPEPMTLAVLGLGALGFLRPRKK